MHIGFCNFTEDYGEKHEQQNHPAPGVSVLMSVASDTIVSVKISHNGELVCIGAYDSSMPDWYIYGEGWSESFPNTLRDPREMTAAVSVVVEHVSSLVTRGTPTTTALVDSVRESVLRGIGGINFK